MPSPATFAEVALNDFKYYLPYEIGRYLIAATVLSAIIWGLKRTAFKARQIQTRSSSRTDFRREFWSSLGTCFVYLIVAVPTDWAIRNGYFAYGGDSWGLWPNLGMTALMFVGHDAYGYWTHRAMHHPRLYKLFHRHHHRSITPTPWTAYAFAPGEAIVNAMFFPVWLSLVPSPGVVSFAFLTLQIIRNVTLHAGIELHPRWWLRLPVARWITTTTHHDLHHAGGFQHNFGFWFTYWDKWMGTEHPGYVEAFDRVTARSRARPLDSRLASSPIL
jgi:Delta7-sterol 5-desaturase